MYVIEATIHTFEYDDNKDDIFVFTLPFPPALNQTVVIDGFYISFKSQPLWHGDLNGNGRFYVDAYKYKPLKDK